MGYLGTTLNQDQLTLIADYLVSQAPANTGPMDVPHTNGVSIALKSFPGIRRRLQQYGSGKIAVYDDYAHNPEKIQALIQKN